MATVIDARTSKAVVIYDGRGPRGLRGERGIGVPEGGQPGQYVTENGDGTTEWAFLTSADIVDIDARIDARIAAAIGAGGAPDTTPDAFTFTDQTGVALGSTRTSNEITVAGLGSGQTAPVFIGGGTYSKNGAVASSAQTTAVNGDKFTVSHTASGSNSTAVDTVLNVGGVSDTFTSTTVAAAQSGLALVSSRVEEDIDIGFTTNGSFPISLPLAAAGDMFLCIFSDTAPPLTLSVGGVAGFAVANTSNQVWRIPGPLTSGSKSVAVTFAADTVHLTVAWFTVNAAPSDVAGYAFGGYTSPGTQPITDMTIPAGGLRVLLIGGEIEPALGSGLTLLSARADNLEKLVRATASTGLSYDLPDDGFMHTCSVVLAQ